MKPVIVMHFSAPTVFGPLTLTVERSHPQKARSEAGGKNLIKSSKQSNIGVGVCVCACERLLSVQSSIHLVKW